MISTHSSIIPTLSIPSLTTTTISNNIHNFGQTVEIKVVQDYLSVDKVEKIINNNPYTIVRWEDKI